MSYPLPDSNDIGFNASPTGAAFMLDPSFIRFILGPVGSGKTTHTMFEVFRRACEQAPGPDGMRRTRFAIVRNTLSQMKQTVLKDVEAWLGPIAYFKSSENLIQIRVNDVVSDWYMIPLDEPANQQRLLSLQLTGAWVNEFIELDPDLISAIAGRCGRFPSAKQGGATWFGIVGDSNMPNAGSRWHEMLDVTVPEDWAVFVQPSGLAEDAENLNFLLQTPETLALPMDHPQRIAQGRTYYERLSRSQAGSWVKRYVRAEYGDDPDGTAVFRESFNRNFHVLMKAPREGIGANSTPDITDVLGTTPGGGYVLTPSMGHTLVIGQDFGRTPCSIITQLDHRGRWLILKELIAENIGLEQHVITALRPALLDPRFAGLPVIVVGDPAGVAKNNHYEETSFDLLRKMGFNAFPASTNKIDPRIRAVERNLLGTVGQGQPQMLIDGVCCPVTVRALHSKYIFGTTNTGESRPLPKKTHPWSDVMDALQYAALSVDAGYSEALHRMVESQKRRSAARSRENLDPEAVKARAMRRVKAWT